MKPAELRKIFKTILDEESSYQEIIKNAWYNRFTNISISISGHYLRVDVSGCMFKHSINTFAHVSHNFQQDRFEFENSKHELLLTLGD